MLSLTEVLMYGTLLGLFADSILNHYLIKNKQKQTKKMMKRYIEIAEIIAELRQMTNNQSMQILLLLLDNCLKEIRGNYLARIILDQQLPPEPFYIKSLDAENGLIFLTRLICIWEDERKNTNVK